LTGLDANTAESSTARHPSAPSGARTLLAFTVATWRLALPLRDVTRIVPLPLLQAPLGAPRFVEGFFDLQGTPVAVVRLDRLFRVEEERLGLYSPLIVLSVQDTPIALHVGRIDGILDDADVRPLGHDETFNACVVGQISDRGETTYLLARDELLLAEERAKVESHRAMRQQRLDALEGHLAHAS
jgi:chemotaxis signal transduction protein